MPASPLPRHRLPITIVGLLGLTAAVVAGCGGEDSRGLATRVTVATTSTTTTSTTTSTTSSVSTTSSTSPSTTSTTTTTSPPPTTSSTLPGGIVFELREDGVGPVRLGMTVDQMIEALGPGYDITFESSIRVDLDGYEVARDGRTLFYASDFGENRISLIMTNNDRVGLASGLRPGLTMADAVDLHGAPTLGFNTEAESRELITFDDGTGGPDSPFTIETLIQAGIYAEVVGGFNQTTDYRPEGRIGWLWVRCFISGPNACP